MKFSLERGTGRKQIGGIAGASFSERFDTRMEMASVELLERVLRRRRWAANDKDAIATFLNRLVMRELKTARLIARKGDIDD